MTSLIVNGRTRAVSADPETPLLWVLREELSLTGTKYGCGIAACGACTVHVDGNAVRSCSIRLGDVGEREVTTIEGLSSDRSHALQRAWIAEQVPQCGYCQTGTLMAAAALLKAVPHPSDADIEQGVTNLCRCGTYARVRAAIRKAVVDG
jgi:aerobic-type carbon monoxide dehydrogenase small subunit (CoxS/CutS family)